MTSDTMIDDLRNRFTGFSLTGFALAIILAILASLSWPEAMFVPYLIIFAIVLLVGSVIVEIAGFYKSRHFTAENAHIVCDKIIQLTNELKSTGSADFSNQPDYSKKYISNERYRNLTKEFRVVMKPCNDYKLYKKLWQYIEFQKLVTKYHLPAELICEKDITNYLTSRSRKW